MSEEKQEYTVKYHAGPYSGTRTVMARDSNEAIAIVRGRIRREMTLPMYSESYRIEGHSIGWDIGG